MKEKDFKGNVGKGKKNLCDRYYASLYAPLRSGAVLRALCG